MKKKISKSKNRFWPVFVNVLVNPKEATGSVVRAKYYTFVFPLVVSNSFLTAPDPNGSAFFEKWFSLGWAVFFFSSIHFVAQIVIFYFVAWSMYRLSDWWGGKGELKDAQAAYALSWIPYFLGLIFRFSLQIPFWVQLFLGRPSIHQLASGMLGWTVLNYFLVMVCVCWALVLSVFNLSVAQRIPIWKSFLVNLLVFSFLWGVQEIARYFFMS